jgi:class 3 adenylate cyclase
MVDQTAPNYGPQTIIPTPGQLLIQKLAKYKFDPEEMQAFAAYIDNASEVELYHINPRRVAAKAEIDLRRALEIAALGVREGILNLIWSVNCAGCNGEMCTFDNLSQTPPEKEMTCPACQMHNTIAADHQLQVTFTIHPSLRKINLPSLAVPGVRDNPPPSPEEFMKLITPEQVQLQDNLLQLAREHPPITGLDLMHVQLFRDFFKDQLLPVHVSLNVTRVALIFTDLRGSTAMYAAKGDPQAYSMVREHFELLAEETARYGGVIIKTIGDAVMASFLRDLDAARAAVAFQHAIADFNRQNNLDGAEALILKVGLHSGPCLSVNLNEVLDYFGTTVNTAARIGSLSKGGDIIVARAMLEEDAVREAFVVGGFVPRESMRVMLRGLPQEVEVTQLIPANQLSEGIAPNLLSGRATGL